jgi:hypothetical protein
MSTTARLNYDCPKCGAKRGDYCVTPSGRKIRDAVGGIHGDRMQFLTPKEMKLSEIKGVMSGAAWCDMITRRINKLKA